MKIGNMLARLNPFRLKEPSTIVGGIGGSALVQGGREVWQEPGAEQLLGMYREWVYAAVDKNAQAVSQVPLRLYVARDGSETAADRRLFGTRPVTKATREEMEGRTGLQPWMREITDVELVTSHPFYDFWYGGNPHLTGGALVRNLVLHMDLPGNAFVYIVSDQIGPLMPVLLAPQTMSVMVDGEYHEITGYRQRVGTDERTYEADEVAHFKHPNPSTPFYGQSPLRACGLAASLYHEMNQYEWALFKNGAVPDVLISPKADHPLTRQQRERLEKRIGQKFGGARKAGGYWVSDGELVISRLGMTQKEMSFADGRALTRKEIAGVFSVPEALLSTDDVNRATSHDAKWFHTNYAVVPRLRLIEEEINRTIIPKYGESRIFAAFDNPVPQDREYNLKRAQVMVATDGLFEKNEARKALGEQPKDEFDGELIEREKIAFPDLPPAEPPEDDEEPEDDAEKRTRAHLGAQKQAPATDEYAERFEKVLRRLFAMQRQAIMAKFDAKAAAPRVKLGEPVDNADSLFRIELWDETFSQSLRPLMYEALGRGATQGAARIGAEFAFDIVRPEIAKFVDEYTYRFARAVNETTQVQLREVFARSSREGLTTFDVADEVDRVMDHAERFRSVRIARTESARSVEAGQLEQWRNSGVVESVYWDEEADACEFCRAMGAKYGHGKGTPVKVGAHFADRNNVIQGLDGGSLALDYDNIQHPPLHPNCRCDLRPVLSGEYGDPRPSVLTEGKE